MQRVPQFAPVRVEGNVLAPRWLHGFLSRDVMGTDLDRDI